MARTSNTSKPLTKTNRITKKATAASKAAAAKDKENSKSRSASTPTGSPAPAAPAKSRAIQAQGPTLHVDDKAYDAIWKSSKRLMGRPIHAEDRDRIEHILRIFDGNADFGPSLGLTRLERWERAEALDLSPPPIIRDILLTKQGQEQDKYYKDSLTQLDTAL